MLVSLSLSSGSREQEVGNEESWGYGAENELDVALLAGCSGLGAVWV